MNVSTKCKLLLEASGISQTKCSKDLDIPVSELNKFFNGKSQLRSDKFIKVLNYVGVNIEDLINKEMILNLTRNIEPNQKANKVSKVKKNRIDHFVKELGY